MKIACPQCGQHYEVEAGMLDRYFRCTECQMLFRGLNAKPVKIRKFRRKNKDQDAAESVAEPPTEENTVNPASTTAAVTVENIEDEAIEAEARFWEKSLENDARDEAAMRYQTSVNWSGIISIVCLILLAITMFLAVYAFSEVNALTDKQSYFGSKGSEYKERLAKLEQRLDNVQNSLNTTVSSVEKLERLLTHINSKVADQTYSREIEALNKSVERLSQNNEEIKKLSAAIDECKQELKKNSASEKVSAKQRKVRR